MFRFACIIMETNENRLPLDLSECFDILKSILENSEDKDWFENSTEDDMINSTHHALGEWIRSNWLLWNKDSYLYQHFFKMGLWHPDDISAFILRSYHRFINKKELNLTEQIEKNINYWKEYKKKYGPIK